VRFKIEIKLLYSQSRESFPHRRFEGQEVTGLGSSPGGIPVRSQGVSYQAKAGVLHPPRSVRQGNSLRPKVATLCRVPKGKAVSLSYASIQSFWYIGRPFTTARQLYDCQFSKPTIRSSTSQGSITSLIS
jgi:hypothetical protein